MKNAINIFIISTILLVNTAFASQVCNSNVKQTRPDTRYTILNNGLEVKDNLTNLIWQRCSLGQTWNGKICEGIATRYNWQQALIEVKKLGNNYRLPNIKELKSLIDYSCIYPAINANIFSNVPEDHYFWSSTPHKHYTKSVWTVSFQNGGVSYGYSYNNQKTNANYYVRAVRSE